MGSLLLTSSFSWLCLEDKLGSRSYVLLIIIILTLPSNGTNPSIPWLYRCNRLRKLVRLWQDYADSDNERPGLPNSLLERANQSKVLQHAGLYFHLLRCYCTPHLSIFNLQVISIEAHSWHKEYYDPETFKLYHFGTSTPNIWSTALYGYFNHTGMFSMKKELKKPSLKKTNKVSTIAAYWTLLDIF